MNLKEIYSRLQAKGTVDLSANFFSSKYQMAAVNRYWDPVTKNAIDVTNTVGGRRMYRQTARPETPTMLASFDGSHWIEESV